MINMTNSELTTSHIIFWNIIELISCSIPVNTLFLYTPKATKDKYISKKKYITD